MRPSVSRQGERPVFGTLDGIRGVAALAVVVFHAPAFFGPIALPSAYLAVDLFFGLSGFVIDHAYQRRLDVGMGAVEFMRTRLVRLYPIYILGTFIGAASSLAALTLGGGALNAPGLLTASATGLFVLPSPTFDQAPQLFPLNSPAWSLFFELVVNLVFALVWRLLTLPRIVGVAVLAGAALAALSIATGGMELGDTWAGLVFGLLRATTSFFVGVALHRYFVLRAGRQTPQPTSWLIPLLLLPLFAAAPQGVWKLAFEMTFIAVVAPICIWLCAHAATGLRLGKTYAFLGAASYAVYALHYPLVELIRRVLHVLGREPEQFAPLLGLTFLGALLLLAWVVDHTYDRQARAFLSRWTTRRERG